MKKFVSILILFFIGLQTTSAETKNVSDYYILKAVELLHYDKNDEALEYVNYHINEFPKDADGYILRAQIYTSIESYSNALNDINKGIKLWKQGGLFKKYSVYWWRASIYEDLEMYDKAISDYSTTYKLALKDDDGENDLNEILSHKAQIHYELNELENADSDYKLMLSHNEADLMAMIGLARNMIKREDYVGAIEMANQCEKYDKSYVGIYQFRMQAYDKLGETEKAIDDAFKYIEFSESPISSLYKPIFKKNINYSMAKVNYRISSETDNYHWKITKIVLHTLNNDYVNAIIEYNNLEQEFGSSQSINYYRSQYYAEIGDYKNAIADITKCVEHYNGKDYYSLAYRGDYYRLSGDYNKAILDFSKMIEIDPFNAYPYYKRGWCYELSKNDDMAMLNYNAGIDVDKNYPYIYLMRGELYKKQGKIDLASKDFNKVLEMDTIVEHGSCRHYALHFLNRDLEAVEWMNRIIETDSTNSKLYYDQACLYARMGKTDDAISALSNALNKGYCAFAHIENDDDLDPIRNLSDFISLISEHKQKNTPIITNSISPNNDSIQTISEIEMRKMYSGVYEIPCEINGLPLKFIFDTGASDVTISSIEAQFMLKNGYLNEESIKGKTNYQIASGEIQEGTIIQLKEIKIGNAILRNVNASVVHNQQAPLLLGQSVLERFGTITIDNINSKLIIKQ